MSKRNLKIEASETLPDIDWTAVDAAPLADTPDEDSPELTLAECTQLQPLSEALPALELGQATHYDHAG